MRPRVLALLVAAMALQAVGCGRWCRCCGSRVDPRDRIPPGALKEGPPLPPPASPSIPPQPTASGRPTGAYGGSGG
ncbi:MAG: hypothetical protein J0I06_05740 [Planctomycetes bacterium]|nr:hypothetical protein [Planctomycetota bacterium]